jgi:fused signal recognition particle receptor
MLAAGDTFRAAAVEQLQEWGVRNDIPVIAQPTGSDSASVVFDAYESAKAKKIDILIADTSGRLHTNDALMSELKKIKRVLTKGDETAPHETLLVIDGGMGQNALSQAVEFNKAMDLTGIAITKLDGTAKGGILFAIAEKLELPIRFIGVGEGIDDLIPLNAKDYVDAVLSTYNTN